MAARTQLTRIGLAALGLTTALCGCASSHTAGGGSSTPQAAVGKLLDDITAKRYQDVPGDLAPGEDAALAGPINGLINQLDRLNVLTPGTSLSNLPGFSVAFANPTYEVTSLNPSVDFVRFTGGTVTASADPSQLPLGSTVRSLAGTLPPRASRSSQLAGENNGLTAIKVGGGWYVSLNYSLAEDGRRSDHLAAPDPSQAVAPAGDSSPDTAVSDFLRSALALNMTRLLALTPPDELPAARDYASLYLPKARAALSGQSSFSGSLRSVSFADRSQADGTLVSVKKIVVEGRVAGTSFTYQDGCASVDGLQVCRNNLGQLATAGHAPAAASDLIDLFARLRPQLGFVTVEENGKWFVSPTRTVLDDATAVLAAVTPAQLDRFIADVKALRSHSG